MPLYRSFKDPDTAFETLQLKLQQHDHDEEEARARALEILARDDDAEPRLLTEANLSALPREARERIEKTMKVHLQIFHRTHPLLPGEKLVHEFCGVLAEDWRDYPKGSAAVVRETSACKEIHIFPYLRLEGASLHTAGPTETGGVRRHVAHPEQLVTFGFDVASIAGDLYLGLLKGLLNKATTELFEYLFPPGPPVWIDQVYTQIRSIVHSEIQQGMLTEVQGRLIACATHVYDYNAFRGEDTDKAQRSLEKAYDICVEVEGLLRQLREPAAMIYCIANGQWFLIMQELARTDAKHLANPLESKWSQVIRDRAAAAAKHAEEMRKSIIAARLKCISECMEHWSYNADITYYFTDSETHYVWKVAKGCTSREAGQCTAAREQYYRRIETEITDKVKDIATSIGAWNQLVQYPLPRPEMVLTG